MHSKMKTKVKVADTMKGYAAPPQVAKAAGGGILYRSPKLSPKNYARYKT